MGLTVLQHLTKDIQTNFVCIHVHSLFSTPLVWLARPSHLNNRGMEGKGLMINSHPLIITHTTRARCATTVLHSWGEPYYIRRDEELYERITSRGGLPTPTLSAYRCSISSQRTVCNGGIARAYCAYRSSSS